MREAAPGDGAHHARGCRGAYLSAHIPLNQAQRCKKPSSERHGSPGRIRLDFTASANKRLDNELAHLGPMRAFLLRSPNPDALTRPIWWSHRHGDRFGADQGRPKSRCPHRHRAVRPAVLGRATGSGRQLGHDADDRPARSTAAGRCGHVGLNGGSRRCRSPRGTISCHQVGLNMLQPLTFATL